MQRTKYSSGPRMFGTTQKKSWFDEGDRCAPGPGTHIDHRFNQTNPPHWTVGKSIERDSFLDKYNRVYPPPNKYNNPSLNTTHHSPPVYSIPRFQQEISVYHANKIDDGSSLDYQPKYHGHKAQIPKYSMGYTYEKDYSTKVPPPNVYDYQISDHKSFSKAQAHFDNSMRPMPEGNARQLPGVGDYNVNIGHIDGARYSIGTSHRHKEIMGMDSPGKFYNTMGNIKHYNKGKTFGCMVSFKKRNQDQDTPAPNKYNPYLPEQTTNIIFQKSQRSNINNATVLKNPSPQKYDTRPEWSKRIVSFTQQKRQSVEYNESPGVGSYQVGNKLGMTLGTMGWKLKKTTEFINPSPADYDPRQGVIRPTSQRPINYESKRIDFTKGNTGPNVGPGGYMIHHQQIAHLGRMNKSLKFQPNHNKNPGPGYYDIPSAIGVLPKYYTGQKKVTTQGYCTHQLAKMENSQRTKFKHTVVEAQEQVYSKMEQSHI